MKPHPFQTEPLPDFKTHHYRGPDWLDNCRSWCVKWRRRETPKAKRCYAWSHLDGQNDERTRFVAVLENPPVVSVETAVRAQIVKDVKEGKLK